MPYSARARTTRGPVKRGFVRSSSRHLQIADADRSWFRGPGRGSRGQFAPQKPMPPVQPTQGVNKGRGVAYSFFARTQELNKSKVSARLRARSVALMVFSESGLLTGALKPVLALRCELVPCSSRTKQPGSSLPGIFAPARAYRYPFRARPSSARSSACELFV